MSVTGWLHSVGAFEPITITNKFIKQRNQPPQHKPDNQSKAELPVKNIMNKKSSLSHHLIAASALLPLATSALAAESPAAAGSASWQKPAWLTDLSLGVTES
jgi:hypothetical protein